MLPRVKLAAFVLVVLTLPLAGCNDSKRTSAVEAGTTTQTAPPPARTYHSRPDLKPPLVRIGTVAHRTGPGYVFIAPKMVVAQAGPMIMDNRGEVIWFKPLNTRGVTDFRVQHYHGKPVLTWWRGHVSNVGVGDGWYVIYDTSYRPVAEVRPGNELVGDVHEFLITKNDTALFTVYHRLPVDLSSVGGPKEGSIWDGIVQEVDIATGRVLFAWQHDARRHADGTITLFDNGAAPAVEKFSRVLVLRANATTKKVTLVRSYHHPKRLLAPFEGNAQLLPNGNILVGWGAQPYVSEFARSGALLFDVYFGQGKPPGTDADSYRAYRFPWNGQPKDRPVIVVAGNTAYSSWNGATDVVRWRVLAGAAAGQLEPVQTVAKNGFETPIRLTKSAAFYAVKALGRDGKVLGTSEAVTPGP